MDLHLPTAYHPAEGRDEEAWRGPLLSGDHDAAIIATPDDTHHRLASAAADAELHTLLVKPFVTNLNDGVQLTRTMRDRNLLGAVEFHKRYDTANRLLRQRIRDGALGRPLYASIAYSQRKIVPIEHFAAWAARTTIFQYLGVHYVDLIHDLTGALPVRALACGQQAFLRGRGVHTYDAMQTLIDWRLDDGHRFISTHTTNWIDPDRSSAMSDQKISFVGTDGRVDADQKNRGFQAVTDAHGVEDINPYFSQFLTGPDGADDFVGYGCESVVQFLRDVSDIRAGKITPIELEGRRPTFASSLVSQAALEAAHESLTRDNAWIETDLSWTDLLTVRR